MNQRQQPDDLRNRGYVEPGTPQSSHQTRGASARKTAEGKTTKEARRAHKRHLANRVIRRMWKDEQLRRERLQSAA